MKFSDVLYTNVEPLWKEITNKEVITGMATGTLEKERYCEYLIQDSLYLPHYTDFLKKTKTYTSDKELIAFLQKLIDESIIELEAVHSEYDRLTHRTISPDSKLAPVLIDYVGYMRQQLETHGFLAGFIAPLQCSWVYAYIAETLKERYADQIPDSPYKSWFDIYGGKAYLQANQSYIDVVDRVTQDISPDKAAVLIEVFKTCAEYENQFRTALV